MLEADRILVEEIKVEVSQEYFRQMTKTLKWKLNDRNLIQGDYTWAL